MQIRKPPRKVALFFNGTWSTFKDSKHIPDAGVISKLMHQIMYHPTNSIVELHNKCELANKVIFDGPGTDLFDKKSQSVTTTFIGLISGNIGVNSNKANLMRAKLYLLNEYEKTRTTGEEALEIHLFGWSRGAFTIWLLKKELALLIKEGAIKITKMHLHNIDPVAGSPFDRMTLRRSKDEDPKDIILTSTSYYSPTGNVDAFEKIPFASQHFNAPFFSALDDDTRGAKKFLVTGNHEDICGNSRSLIQSSDTPSKSKAAAGNIILAHIVAEASKQGVPFNTAWKNEVFEASLISKTHYTTTRVQDCSRLFLSHASLLSQFRGLSAKSVINLSEFKFESEIAPVESTLIHLLEKQHNKTPLPFLTEQIVSYKKEKNKNVIEKLRHSYSSEKLAYYDAQNSMLDKKIACLKKDMAERDSKQILKDNLLDIIDEIKEHRLELNKRHIHKTQDSLSSIQGSVLHFIKIIEDLIMDLVKEENFTIEKYKEITDKIRLIIGNKAKSKPDFFEQSGKNNSHFHLYTSILLKLNSFQADYEAWQSKVSSAFKMTN